MTGQSGIAIVRHLYDSFVRGDINAVVATLSDDLHWRESENFLRGNRNPYLSPADVVEGVFSRIAKEFQDYQAGPTELIDAGDMVVAVGRSKGVMASTGKTARRPVHACRPCRERQDHQFPSAHRYA